MVSQVSDRGQITIDRTARERLGVRPGMIAHQRVVSGRLEIVFLPAPHRRSLYGVFQTADEEAKTGTAEDIENAIMEAVAEGQAQQEADNA